jgi:mercuric ion transport protein
MTINDAAQETPPAVRSSANPAAPKWFAAVGLVAGLGAVIASSCCVIPLGLAALGAGASVFGGLEMVAEWRLSLLAVSGLAIVGGWGAWWWRGPAACAAGSACASPRRSLGTLGLLLCASLIVALAAGWGYMDPVLLKLLKGR